MREVIYIIADEHSIILHITYTSQIAIVLSSTSFIIFLFIYFRYFNKTSSLSLSTLLIKINYWQTSKMHNSTSVMKFYLLAFLSVLSIFPSGLLSYSSGIFFKNSKIAHLEIIWDMKFQLTIFNNCFEEKLTKAISVVYFYTVPRFSLDTCI